MNKYTYVHVFNESQFYYFNKHVFENKQHFQDEKYNGITFHRILKHCTCDAEHEGIPQDNDANYWTCQFAQGKYDINTLN